MFLKLYNSNSKTEPLSVIQNICSMIFKKYVTYALIYYYTSKYLYS